MKREIILPRPPRPPLPRPPLPLGSAFLANTAMPLIVWLRSMTILSTASISSTDTKPNPLENTFYIRFLVRDRRRMSENIKDVDGRKEKKLNLLEKPR